MSVALAGAAERKKLDSIRAEISRLEAEAEAINEAPFSHEQAVAVTLSMLQRRRADLRHEMAGHTRGPQAGALPPDVGLWLLTDEELEHRVRTCVERENVAPGLPQAERGPRIAELKQQIEQLLVDEEAEVCRLERAGFLIDRRVPESAADVDRLLDQWEGA